MRLKSASLAAALLLGPCLVHAQFDFHVAGRNVQIHSFASQGFAFSDQNNYLTMKTSDGTFAMTDGGVNASVNLTDKFRVGAQFYIRNIGNLGNYRPELDWAYGDYRFTEWLGLRAGKVKTALGLYNDTQDLEFLHTWAILPQSAYPLDLRASTIAHTGGDLYGTIALKRLGNLSYTAYAGRRADDPNGGYRYGLQANRIQPLSTNGNQIGGDLRWSNLLSGLTVGVSYLNGPQGADATVQVAPTRVFPVNLDASDRTRVYYGEYKRGRLTLAGEYRREILKGTQKVGPMPSSQFSIDERGWWASAAFRVCRRLELGTYHSRFYPSAAAAYKGSPANHMFDQVATARVDLMNHWDLKLEGHFIDGFGNPQSFRGFYPQQNPAGIKPETTMLVVRTGWNF